MASVTRKLEPQPSGVPRPKGIFDPVARALDVIGGRWTLVLVRQLLGEPRGFQELRLRTGIAPRVLSSRLRELVSAGFVETVAHGSRSLYRATELGHSLEPIISATGRWYVATGMRALDVELRSFDDTSAQAVLEALPLLLREDRARGVDLTFEVRLTGSGGGVWTVRIADGHCVVESGFAERADVRYTADARVWCRVALGALDARHAYERGLMTKDGGREAMDHYFHQLAPQGPDPGRAPRRMAASPRSNEPEE